MESKRFKAKRFEPRKIDFKVRDAATEAAIDKEYLENLERGKRWNKNISKFFAPVKKILSPVTDRFSNKLFFYRKK